MIIKDGTHVFITKFLKICSTFLIVGIVLFNTVVIGSAAQKYSGVNDTAYVSADTWSLDELPYGDDTGVVQIEYANKKYITIFFDKLTVYEGYLKHDEPAATYIGDYYWSLEYYVSGSTVDYVFNCASDSPVYYHFSTDSSTDIVHVMSTSGRAIVEDNFQLYVDPDTNTVNTYNDSYTHYVHYCEDVRLSSVVPDDWYIDTKTNSWDPLTGVVTHSRTVYANCHQYDVRSNGLYEPFRADGYSVVGHLSNVGYYLTYYPTSEYLHNIESRQSIVMVWNELIGINDLMNVMYGEIYTVNYYLADIYWWVNTIDYNISDIQLNLQTQLPLINENLSEIIKLLEGPEFDSSQGIGSNTEFGDAVGGLMQDTEIPDSNIGGIQSNLGNSFLFIRGAFDWINRQFNLGYVITFLLGMSFIAYVLGRVIKNKMNG